MSSLYTVWFEYDEPDYPPGIQRTGRRRSMILSARASSEEEAVGKAKKMAEAKGFINVVAVKAQVTEVG